MQELPPNFIKLAKDAYTTDLRQPRSKPNRPPLSSPNRAKNACSRLAQEASGTTPVTYTRLPSALLDGPKEANCAETRRPAMLPPAVGGGAGGERHEVIPLASAEGAVDDSVAGREGAEAGERVGERGVIGARGEAVDEEPAVVGGRRVDGGMEAAA
jgi:hypothetical protein